MRINKDIKEIHSERAFTAVRDSDGNIREIRFDIKVHEGVMFDLI